MDRAIIVQTRVAYAGIYVEIKAGVDLPSKLKLIDEKGKKVRQDVKYERMFI